MDKESIITPEIVRQLLDYDPNTGHLTWRFRSRDKNPETAPHILDMFNTSRAGKLAGSHCTQGYIQLRITYAGKGFVFKGHRVAWAWVHGQWPPDQIDHVNGKRDDNRISNLRNVTMLENNRNKGLHPRNKSGHWGVRWVKGAWEAKFRTATENHYIGRFPTKEEAARAVRKRASEIGGYTERHGREAS